MKSCRGSWLLLRPRRQAPRHPHQMSSATPSPQPNRCRRSTEVPLLLLKLAQLLWRSSPPAWWMWLSPSASRPALRPPMPASPNLLHTRNSPAPESQRAPALTAPATTDAIRAVAPPGCSRPPARRTAGWLLDPGSAAGTPPAAALALLRTCLASLAAPEGLGLAGWSLPQLGSALWAAASLAGALRDEAEAEEGPGLKEGAAALRQRAAEAAEADERGVRGRGLVGQVGAAVAALEAWLAGPEGSAAAERCGGPGPSQGSRRPRPSTLDPRHAPPGPRPHRIVSSFPAPLPAASDPCRTPCRCCGATRSSGVWPLRLGRKRRQEEARYPQQQQQRQRRQRRAVDSRRRIRAWLLRWMRCARPPACGSRIKARVGRAAV